MFEMSQWMTDMSKRLQSLLDADILAEDSPCEYEVKYCFEILDNCYYLSHKLQNNHFFLAVQNLYSSVLKKQLITDENLFIMKNRFEQGLKILIAEIFLKTLDNTLSYLFWR